MTAGTGTTAPTTTTAPARASLRGDIEGLRAIAVLMVLLYHAGVPGFRGGFAGVDVFFVISGYLITGQLVKEALRDGRVSLTRFYARRARRLLPAASLVLAATAVAGWWLLPRSRHGELGVDLLGATTYVVNWVLARREVDYLAEDSEPSLVQHYWSLSVEEQFYVVWPLLIILVLWLSRRAGLRLLPGLTVALTLVIGASLTWSILLTDSSPGTAYFVTTTRLWELGLGGLLVLATPVLSRLPGHLASVLAWVGLAMVLATIGVVGTGTPWPGSAALLPTVGTAAVILAGIAAPDSSVARILGTPPMRFLGALSYGLYLWHWPALRLLEEVVPDAALPSRLAVAALSVGLAWATLHLVENPIRFHRALSASTARALGYGALSMALTASLGAALTLSAPHLDDDVREEVLLEDAGAIGLVQTESRAAEELVAIPDPTRIYTASGPIYPDPAVAVDDVPLAAYGEDCQVSAESVELLPEDACRFGDPEADIEVAMVGDSKMLQWLTALDPIAQREGWRLKVYTKSGCGFAASGVYPECEAYNARLSDLLGDGEHTPDLIITSMVQHGDEALGQAVSDSLQPAVRAGADVLVLADNPAPQRKDLPKEATLYGCVEENPDNYSLCSYRSRPGSGTPALTVAADELEAPLIDLSRWVCPDPAGRPEPACPPVIGGVLVFRQGSHLTASYVASLTPILHHELQRVGLAQTPPEEIPWQIPPR